MTLRPQRRAVVVAALVLVVTIGMLAFGSFALLSHRDLATGGPLVVAGAYGAWQVLTTPLAIAIDGARVRVRGLRPIQVQTRAIERIQTAGSWRGERVRFFGHGGAVLLEIDAGVFDLRRLEAALAAAGVRSVAQSRAARREDGPRRGGRGAGTG